MKTISEYIKSAPKESQKHLKAMYAVVKKSAPKAVEGLKWSMPSFSNKRILVNFAGFKHHVGLYPTPSAIKKFKSELAKYKTAVGSVQFPLDKPLPLAPIKKIVAFRVKEEKDRDAKWKP